MKRFFTVLAVVCLGLSIGCRQKAAPEPAKAENRPVPTAPPVHDDTWLRVHFVGGGALATNSDASKLKAIAELPASQALRKQTITKLATALPELLWQKTNTTALAEKISPLLEDLFHAELAITASGPTNLPAGWTLAIQLTPERSQLWQTGLKAFYSEGSGSSPKDIQLEGHPGWETQDGTLRLINAGQWVLLSRGPAHYAADAFLLKNIKATGKPIASRPEQWLEIDADVERLARMLSLPTNVAWPRVALTVTGKTDNLRTTFHGICPAPVKWQLEPWLIPTNTIQDPVNSFTALQAITPILKMQKRLINGDLLPTPNQIFFWAQTDLPYQSFLAFSLPDATNQVRQMLPAIEKLMTPILDHPGKGRLMVTTNGTILWRDAVPVLMPFLRAAPERDNNFAIAGVFPAEIEPKPLPAELLAQITGRTNLLYYDWEITEVRLGQWRQLSQLLLMFSSQIPPMESPGVKWLQAIAPMLGNTVTEITANSPVELAGVRKSHLGLTAVELTLLTYWLDSPAFPRFVSPFDEQAITPMLPPVPPNPGVPVKKP